MTEERRRRRLAVRAGDGEAGLHAHQLGEHLGARDHRGLQLTRAHHLRVREPHRRRNDDDVGARADAIGVVAERDRRAEARQALGRVARGEIGPGDDETEVQQHLGDATHADAADPNEVNVALLARERHADLRLPPVRA